MKVHIGALRTFVTNSGACLSALPRYHRINDFLLLHAAPSKIDAGCFDAFVSHEVGKQCQVVELFQEVLGIAMTEGMRIDNFLVQSVLHGVVLQLL